MGCGHHGQLALCVDDRRGALLQRIDERVEIISVSIRATGRVQELINALRERMHIV